MHNTEDRAVNWRWRSFKVNDFCCNRKPIYDFLLVNNRHLSCILHRWCRYEDTRTVITSRSRKPPHPILSPRSKGPSSNFAVKSSMLKVELWRYTFVWKSHNSNFSRLVTILLHLRHRRQTTYHNNSWTLQCNCSVRLKIREIMRFLEYISFKPLRNFLRIVEQYKSPAKRVRLRFYFV